MRRCPGGGNSNPLQYSCLENSMDRGAWRNTVHAVVKESDTTEKINLISHRSMEQLLRAAPPAQMHTTHGLASPAASRDTAWPPAQPKSLLHAPECHDFITVVLVSASQEFQFSLQPIQVMFTFIFPEGKALCFLWHLLLEMYSVM